MPQRCVRILAPVKYCWIVKVAEHAVSSIVPDKRESWEDKWFLTFDMDFALDEVIEETLDLLSGFNVRGTFFLTGATSHINRIRETDTIDVGIHPNFNSLLGETCHSGESAKKALDDLLILFPEAKSVRSHSLTQSSRLHQLFTDSGLTHESNTFVPSGRANAPSPWVDWTGLVRVPFHWEDDVYCLYKNADVPEPAAAEVLSRNHGFCVFNFHPIHVFLNTESLAHYEAARPFHHDLKMLSGYRNQGYGTRDRLVELLRSVER